MNIGEPGFEVDTGKLKIGNGYHAWNDLPYVGGEGSETLIFNALTRNDFPSIGRIDMLYKATKENQLYQWDNENQTYNLLFSEDYITQEKLYEVIEDIDETLENYATTTFTQELYNNITPLSK